MVKIFTREYVARRIDYAVLKPAMTHQDLTRHADVCRQYHVGTLCVRPTDVAFAAQLLEGSDTTLGCVVGFPHGCNHSEVKALEARLAMEEGARELDMVMNIGLFLSGQYDHVRKDMEAVTQPARKQGVLVKVILETCFLTPEQIACACGLALDAGARFVKTSTGLNGAGATPEAVEIMLKTVAGRIGVKASGGIRTWDAAVAFLEMGCTRLGVGDVLAVLNGGVAEGLY